MMRYFLLLLAVLFFPLLAQGKEKPNILLIIADDLCWRDLGCNGSKDVRSPNIDRLAKQGISLKGMFTSSPTCSPTRHALYTGLYPIRSGAYPNHTMVDSGTRSIFHYLKNEGYRVALHGKEHVKPRSSFPYEYLGNESEGSIKKAREFITRQKPDQPWFLVVASNEPHSPWNLGPHYDPGKISVPPYMHDNLVTRNMLSKYFAEISDLDRQVGELMQSLNDSKQTDNTLVLFISEQGCSLPYGGKWSLYDTGIRIAAFARWPGKIAAGTSTPALMQYVDVAPTLVAIAGGDPARIDTGCQDASGYKGFDGRNALDVWLGKMNTHRQYIFAQHTTVGVNGYKQPYPMRAVRDSRYKLIRNLAAENRFEIGGIHAGEPLASWKQDARNNPALQARIDWLYKRPPEELYDLETDEFEGKNLISLQEYREVRTRLGKELDAWMHQQGDKGLETEMKALSRQPKNNKP